MDGYATIYLVVVMGLAAGGGLLYFRLAGKAFDRKYGRDPK